MTRALRRFSLLALFAACAAMIGGPGCAGDEGRAAGAGYETVGSTSQAVTRKCGAASNGAVQGRDVSVYQGNFDWAGAKAGGVVFGYARISDGLNSIDSTFAGNWASMKTHGVLRGAYQFFEPGQDEVAQANMMVQKVGGKLGDGDLPAMIDVEATGGQAPATIAKKVRHWLQIVEAGTGKRPFIYTGAYFWQDNVRDTTFGQYPIWIAAYGPTCPSLPDGWSDWAMWQYSDGAGKLDHDVYNGSLASLQALAGGSSAPSFPPMVRRSATDVNGDGASDVCGRSKSGVVCELAGNGAFPAEITGPEWSDDKGWKDDRYGSTVQFGDVNGDGNADVCGRSKDGFRCVLSNGTAFATPIDGPPWSDVEGWDGPEYYSTIQLADVNGDGKLDACARGYSGIQCYLADGQGFPTQIKGPAWSDPEGWDAPQYYSSIQYADVNGDGKDDVCGRGYAGVFCYLSDGNGFPTKVEGPAWSDPTGWDAPSAGSTVRLVDLDGDGKADVCGRSSAGVRCALSLGDAFAPEIQGPEWSDAHGWAKPEYYGTITYADFDGDGRRDVCARAAAGITCSPFDGQAFGAPYDGPAWTDAEGWNKPQYYMTLGAADVNHDGKDDLCGRAKTGIVCAASHGGGFDPSFAGPAWSDASGWGAGPYYSSIRYLGDPRAGAALPGGGPGGGGAGVPGDPIVGGGGGGDDDGGCSVRPTRGRGAPGGRDGIIALGVLACLSLARRRSRAPAPGARG